MHRSSPITALLLGAALAGVMAPTPAVAQRCEVQLEKIAARKANASVSVADMRIPQKAWRHFEKARAARAAHRDDVFEREADQALAAAPTFTEVYVLRAAAQLNAGQYEAVIETIAAARRIQPEVAWSGIVLATALSQLHRYDEAAAEMDRVRGPEAASWEWLFERTRAEIGRRNVDGALHWSEVALASAPSGCVDAHLLRANALQLAGRWEDAIVQLEAYLASGGELPYRPQVVQALEKTRETLREDNAHLLATNEAAH